MIEIAIIGGGAAGFFAAIAAKATAPNARVVIFEKSRKVLTKVGLSGGGRCNLTNAFEGIADLKRVYPRGDKLLKRLFRTFGPQEAYAWFEDRGVPLVTQDDGCVFPRSQNAQSIVRCLTEHAAALGVEVRTSAALVALQRTAEGWRLRFREDTPAAQRFDRVLVATGGAPRAESRQWLAETGVRFVAPVPSLFTFEVGDAALRRLMGTVVEPVAVSLPGTKFRATGALLITHWGMSGPAVLKLSSYAARHVAERDYRFPVAVNWLHDANAETAEKLLTNLSAHTRKQLHTLHPAALPSRLWEHLLQRAALAPDKTWGEVGRKAFNRLIEVLTNDRYEVVGRAPFRDEFVTCGGVSLDSVHPNTLESKTDAGLFFAGEALDVDAVTGGFNLQAAWTTGYVAGIQLTAEG